MTVKELRDALAYYISSEGCSCCRNLDAHREAEERLGMLLHARKYPDGSGWDFTREGEGRGKG